MRTAIPVRRGFTLIEILVVIGIIVILAGILVPMVTRARRQAGRTLTAASLQSIGTALDAFKNDHGDYPASVNANAGAGTLGRYLFGSNGNATFDNDNNPVTPEVIDPQDPLSYNEAQNYLPGDTVRNGAALTDLTWVCIQATTGNASPATRVAPPSAFWAFVGTTDVTGATDGVNDGADGPGIKVRGGGKKWGPYLQDGKFKFRGAAVLDGNDNPILYFPASAGKPNVTLAGGYLPPIAPLNPPNDDLAQYDPSDNWLAFQRLADGGSVVPAQQRIHAMLGDLIMMPAAQAGAINTASGEPEAQTAPYVLWAAGPDGVFGPADIGDGSSPASLKLNREGADRCDDVTNFRQ